MHGKPGNGKQSSTPGVTSSNRKSIHSSSGLRECQRAVVGGATGQQFVYHHQYYSGLCWVKLSSRLEHHSYNVAPLSGLPQFQEQRLNSTRYCPEGFQQSSQSRHYCSRSRRTLDLRSSGKQEREKSRKKTLPIASGTPKSYTIWMQLLLPQTDHVVSRAVPERSTNMGRLDNH